jgi:hypothetical protein
VVLVIRGEFREKRGTLFAAFHFKAFLHFRQRRASSASARWLNARGAKDQTLELQVDALTQTGCTTVNTAIISGTR